VPHVPCTGRTDVEIAGQSDNFVACSIPGLGVVSEISWI
jgi:hypothetical protein